MVITFKQDETLSYDGINTRTYKKGEVYTPKIPREKSVFEHMVNVGKAEIVTDVSVNEKKSIKVVKPKAKK